MHLSLSIPEPVPSFQFQLTTIALVYQSLLPSVPTIDGVAVGGVVSEGAHEITFAVTFIVSSRTIPLFLHLYPYQYPVPLYNTDPEKEETEEPATNWTSEVTASLIVLLAIDSQLSGSVITFSSPIFADNPGPETVSTSIVTVVSDLNAFPPPARFIATGTETVFVLPRHTSPRDRSLFATGATPSPSATVLSANTKVVPIIRTRMVTSITTFRRNSRFIFAFSRN